MGRHPSPLLQNLSRSPNPFHPFPPPSQSKSPRPISKEGEEDYEAAGAATAETQHAGEGEEGGDVVERLIRSMEEQIDRDSLTDEAIELLRLVPTGYIPLPHQVGGHRHIDGKPGTPASVCLCVCLSV